MAQEKKEYFKGFILDKFLMIADVIGVESANDPEVDIYTDIIIWGFNRDGYKFIGLVRDPARELLALAIVLEVGNNAEELRKMELPIDDTIMAAKPYVLVGPDVWELYV